MFGLDLFQLVWNPHITHRSRIDHTLSCLFFSLQWVSVFLGVSSFKHDFWDPDSCLIQKLLPPPPQDLSQCLVLFVLVLVCGSTTSSHISTHSALQKGWLMSNPTVKKWVATFIKGVASEVLLLQIYFFKWSSSNGPEPDIICTTTGGQQFLLFPWSGRVSSFSQWLNKSPVIIAGHLRWSVLIFSRVKTTLKYTNKRWHLTQHKYWHVRPELTDKKFYSFSLKSMRISRNDPTRSRNLLISLTVFYGDVSSKRVQKYLICSRGKKTKQPTLDPSLIETSYFSALVALPCPWNGENKFPKNHLSVSSLSKAQPEHQWEFTGSQKYPPQSAVTSATTLQETVLPLHGP